MTSTEFTCGLGDDSRVSSKVLKPPGGGSSDIFGLGDSSNEKSNAEKKVPETTRTRLFGDPSDPLPPTPNKNVSLHKSSIFQNGAEVPVAPTRGKRVYVVRNPITGEESEINPESENGDKSELEKEVVKVEEPVTSVPASKPVTSIRVRNPPGGKSSGIF